MPFGRFFGNKPKESAPQSDAPDDDNEPTDDSGEQDDAGEPESIPAEHDESDWLTRARAVLPTGASTGSKRVEALYGSSSSTGPPTPGSPPCS